MTTTWGKAVSTTVNNWVRSLNLSGHLADVVATARKFIGAPYVLGGSSRRGIDCSGLVKQAYAAIGVTLPHKAQEIRKLGVEVPLNALQAGDVLYIITGTSTEHVGIYDGKGSVIHSTSVYGKAVSEPVSNWVTKGWLDGARRIV